MGFTLVLDRDATPEETLTVGGIEQDRRDLCVAIIRLKGLTNNHLRQSGGIFTTPELKTTHGIKLKDKEPNDNHTCFATNCLQREDWEDTINQPTTRIFLRENVDPTLAICTKSSYLEADRDRTGIVKSPTLLQALTGIVDGKLQTDITKRYPRFPLIAHVGSGFILNPNRLEIERLILVGRTLDIEVSKTGALTTCQQQAIDTWWEDEHIPRAKACPTHRPILEMLFAKLMARGLPEDESVEETKRLFGIKIGKQMFDARTKIAEVMKNEPWLKS